MLRLGIFVVIFTVFTPSAYADPGGESSLLALCDSFGETSKECRCYLDEVKQIYMPADIELAGSAVRAFMKGEQPEAIVAYLLVTRKLTLSRARAMYKRGDQHSARIGKKCEDKNQKITPEIKAKREAMGERLEKIGARYRIGE